MPTDSVIDEFEEAGGQLSADVCQYHVVKGQVTTRPSSNLDPDPNPIPTGASNL